ncbi:hypothetical protein TPA0907_31890 [Micromonospora humidisoli]|nr:hypothetical protein TPA0907_31890 [Micromonospora sp. AKA109]
MPPSAPLPTRSTGPAGGSLGVPPSPDGRHSDSRCPIRLTVCQAYRAGLPFGVTPIVAPRGPDRRTGNTPATTS